MKIINLLQLCGQHGGYYVQFQNNGWTIIKLKIKKNKTLKQIMEEKCFPVPSEQQDENKMTIFDKTYFDIIPNIQNHKPEEQNEDDWTAAMIFARKGITPPVEWQHNPTIQNKYGNTVGILLASNKILPPKEWIHDINLESNGRYSIASELARKGCIYKDGQIIPNYKTQLLNNKCQKCQSEGEQEFIITNCGDLICLKCFKKLTYLIIGVQKCPICKQKNWFEKIE